MPIATEVVTAAELIEIAKENKSKVTLAIT